MFPPCPLPASLAALPPRPPPPPPATGAKGERDAWGSWPASASSANFVVKWGGDPAVDDDDAARVLDRFEAAWAVEIDAMGHAPPAGAETWKFNVYLGDTGGDAPPTWGYAGYYTVDDEGWPMVVVNPDAIDQGYLEGVSAHEFYHAVQHGTGAWLDSPEAGWWWEATAMWVEGEVWPADPDHATFLFGFGLAPQLPLWHDEPFAEGTLGEYHPYGAFVFPRFLSEVVGDRDLVTGTWTDPGGAPSPQERLAEQVDFWPLFGDFVARAARWDYAEHDLYTTNLDTWRDTFQDDPDQGEVAARLVGPGVAAGLEVHGGGYVQVDLVAPGAATWTATVAPADGLDLVGTVVRDTVEGLVYEPLAVDPAGGLVGTWTSAASEGTTRIVIGAATFAPDAATLTVQLDTVTVAEDTAARDTGTAPPTSCGCGAGGDPGGLALVGLLVGLLTRRGAPRPAPSSR